MAPSPATCIYMVLGTTACPRNHLVAEVRATADKLLPVRQAPIFTVIYMPALKATRLEAVTKEHWPSGSTCRGCHDVRVQLAGGGPTSLQLSLHGIVAYREQAEARPKATQSKIALAAGYSVRRHDPTVPSFSM